MLTAQTLCLTKQVFISFKNQTFFYSKSEVSSELLVILLAAILTSSNGLKYVTKQIRKSARAE